MQGLAHLFIYTTPEISISSSFAPNILLLGKIRGIREAQISWLKVGEENIESEWKILTEILSFAPSNFHSLRQSLDHEIAQIASFCPLLLLSTD